MFFSPQHCFRNLAGLADGSGGAVSRRNLLPLRHTVHLRAGSHLKATLGELMSGIFYGFMIPFLLLYINMPEGYYLTLDLGLEIAGVEIQVMPVVTLLLPP